MLAMTTLRIAGTDPVMDELARNLTGLLDAKGWSLHRLERELVKVLGDDAPSVQTLSTYHRGTITSARVNLRIVAGLCTVYGVTMDDVSPDLADRARDLTELLVPVVGANNSFAA